MKVCDRCPGYGSCLLNYLGKACDQWRKKNAPDVFATNADRIRAMSDEELANLLTSFSHNAVWISESGRQICYEKYQKWLQQPAEEATT